MVHFNSFNKISKYTLDSYKSVLIIQIKQYIYMFKTAINSFFFGTANSKVNMKLELLN